MNLLISEIYSDIAPTADSGDLPAPNCTERNQLSGESSESEDELNREEDTDITDTVEVWGILTTQTNEASMTSSGIIV